MKIYQNGKEITFNYAVVMSLSETDDGCAEVFGIKAEMYEDGELISREYVPDIFCTRAEADEFAAILRENGVDPCQLIDVADDWLEAKSSI